MSEGGDGMMVKCPHCAESDRPGYVAGKLLRSIGANRRSW